MDDYMYWVYAGFGEEEDNNSMEVELGSIYQINHSKLTPRTPVPLRSIRLVMVSEKTDWNVSVRYPSIESLKRYFNNKYNEIYPEMDQRFVMDRKLAERVLFRRVPSEEFLVKKDMEDFWLVMSSSGGSAQSGDVVSKKAGFCLSELKSSGVPGWGVRRQVKFIGRHREMNTSPSSSSIANKGVEETVVTDEEIEERKEEKEERVEEIEEERVEEEEEEEEKLNEEREEEEKVEEEEDEDEEEEEENAKEEEVETYPIKVETYQRPKRKCCEVNLKVKQKPKKVKSDKKTEKPKKEKSNKKTEKPKKEKSDKKTENKKKPKNKCMEIVLAAKTPLSSRWSGDRYKQAQKHLLEVMKATGAVCEKPILRPELRAEARKKIGDTGLLDHLLKHVAGMVAPGGAERFRRRHNTDGAMEYWLESANLVELRREVGVDDPFWTPPPGWKIGDSPTQDPICAQEIKELKEETSRLKSEMKALVSRKKMEKELVKLRREMEKLKSKNQTKEVQAIVVSKPAKKELRAMPTSCNCDSSFAKMEKYYKEQLSILSDRFTRVEGEMVNLKSKMEEKTSFYEQALIALTEAFTEKEKTKIQTSDKTVAVPHPQMEKTTFAEKAAKIERLKSGFRICKPQGTFLWPNNSSNVVVQVDDVAAAVPTPPSVSSATAFAPPPQLVLPPASPVKPLPEKRAITVTVSSVGNSNFSSTTTTTTTTSGSSNKTTTWINLNDVPRGVLEGGLCGALAIADVPPVSVKGDLKQSSAGSCSKKEVDTWLALAAPTDLVEDPTRG